MTTSPIPAGGPLAATGYWLHHAALAWRRELDTRLRPMGLTHTQFTVLGSLSWLGRTDDSPTQQAVADLAGTDRMMTSKLCAQLEARGLITREPHPDSARANLLALTTEGRAAVTAATAIARAVDRELFGAVADPDGFRQQLADLSLGQAAEGPAGSRRPSIDR